MPIHHVDLFTFTRRFIPTYPGYTLRIPSLFYSHLRRLANDARVSFSRESKRVYFILIIRAPPDDDASYICPERERNSEEYFTKGEVRKVFRGE